MPVDLYVGGAEHAVLHLLYSRFWIKALADAGLVPFREPFKKLINQGQLQGADGARMAKSRGNVITPDSIAESYGADALRIYELFMAPFEQDVAWKIEGISGASRFLNRVWNLFGETYSAGADFKDEDQELLRRIHKTIRRAEERIEGFRFNTMVSTLMEFVNFLSERQRTESWQTATFHQALDVLLLLMAPAAPHLVEEIWALIGRQGSIHQQSWPEWDAELAQDVMISLPVQVDGRLRDVLEIPQDAEQDDIRQAALAMPRLQQALAGRNVERVVYSPGKILNFVTRLDLLG